MIRTESRIAYLIYDIDKIINNHMERYFPVICISNYSHVKMSPMASQITGVSNVYSTVCSGYFTRSAYGFFYNMSFEITLLELLPCIPGVDGLRSDIGKLIRLDTLQWRHNERDGVSNYRPLDRLPNRLFRRRSKKKSKFRDTGLCEGNPPVDGGFP